MPASSQRLTKKEIRQPDEFQQATRRALEWSRQHTQALAWGGAGFVALVLAIGITVSYRSARRYDANAELGQALAALRADDVSGAHSELVDTARRWEGTTPGRIAAVLAAVTELRRANPASAAVKAEQALDDAGDDLPVYLRQELLYALAAAHEEQESWPEAAQRYAEAAEVAGPFTADAVLGEARAREQMGEADRARELYRKYYDQFPDGIYREMVREKAGV